MTPPIIHIEALSKTYRRRGKPPVHAVDNLTLSVPAGQIFGFLGENGAGKTTTIKMLCGLVAPSGGHISIEGHDVHSNRRQAMRRIGAVLEGTRNVYWRLSAWQNLLYFARLKGHSGKAVKARAERLLRELDLWERRKDAVGSFSRGMQQKVAIACALIADPPVVLLDEPTLGLDVGAARTVKTWVEKLAREEGKTIVLTTHQLDMAQSLCDRIAIMRAGKLIADQPTPDLLGLFRQDYYEIRLGGHLNGERPAWLEGLELAEENGHTVLSGAIRDQQTLHTLLGEARKLGLPLHSVSRTEPDLEEVFVQLMNQES